MQIHLKYLAWKYWKYCFITASTTLVVGTFVIHVIIQELTYAIYIN